MAQSKQKTLPISADWQIGFIAAMTLYWLANIASLLVPFLGDGFIGAGTWTFQASLWVYPLFYLAVAWLLVAPHYANKLQKLFVAIFTTSVFYSLFSALAAIENTLRNRFYPPAPVGSSDHSYWTAFGHEWTVMIVGFGVYILVLLALSRRLSSKHG